MAQNETWRKAPARLLGALSITIVLLAALLAPHVGATHALSQYAAQHSAQQLADGCPAVPIQCVAQRLK